MSGSRATVHEATKRDENHYLAGLSPHSCQAYMCHSAGCVTATGSASQRVASFPRHEAGRQQQISMLNKGTHAIV